MLIKIRLNNIKIVNIKILLQKILEVPKDNLKLHKQYRHRLITIW
jgi:hypothetical protein